jgi:ABC-type polysaccharide/polyol phosphate transport system ATPase subunit
MVDVRFDSVSKRYFVEHHTLRPRRRHWPALGILGRGLAEHWALRNASFEVRTGEALGIVGHNGAGKSTILKLLCGITAPTSGQISIRGRLAALVDIGSGFHPELTGRENIFLSGSMLGMSRAEITRKVEGIIEFAGVRDYIDVPVKRYSSGMYVRLGFSIAAHLDPDLLLLDEVLAVGDIAFQAKCLDRISDFRDSGCTIVLVSHDLATVERLCDRALLLDHGHIIMDGPPSRVIERYQTLAFGEPARALAGAERDGLALYCTEITFDSTGQGAPIRTGYPMRTRLAFHSRQALTQVVFNVYFYWPSGYLCTHLTTALDEPGLATGVGSGMLEFLCPVLEIQPGLYRVDYSIESNGQCIDRRLRCATLRVDPGRAVFGDFYMDHTWQVSYT